MARRAPKFENPVFPCNPQSVNISIISKGFVIPLSGRGVSANSQLYKGVLHILCEPPTLSGDLSRGEMLDLIMSHIPGITGKLSTLVLILPFLSVERGRKLEVFVFCWCYCVIFGV